MSERYKVEVKQGDPKEATVMEDPCYKPPGSEMEKLLERVAQALTDEIASERLDNPETPDELILRVLTAKVLPLLLAGQETRDSIAAYAVALANRQDGLTMDDKEIHAAVATCVQAVKSQDAAKQKAMEGK